MPVSVAASTFRLRPSGSLLPLQLAPFPPPSWVPSRPCVAIAPPPPTSISASRLRLHRCLPSASPLSAISFGLRSHPSPPSAPPWPASPMLHPGPAEPPPCPLPFFQARHLPPSTPLSPTVKPTSWMRPRLPLHLIISTPSPSPSVLTVSPSLPREIPTYFDLNTTAFIHRVIQAEKPDLVVFTDDNIFGSESMDAAKSMAMAFALVVTLKLPWAVVPGNHDQEGTLSRGGVMQYIMGMPHTLSCFNPDGVDIDSFGNYNSEVHGVEGSTLANKKYM